jgi:hypothetical protein
MGETESHPTAIPLRFLPNRYATREFNAYRHLQLGSTLNTLYCGGQMSLGTGLDLAAI